MDRKGTVRLHPEGTFALCSEDYDRTKPAAARWIMSKMHNGSSRASDLFIKDWPLHFTPDPPVGTILVRNDEIAYKVRLGYFVVESSGDSDFWEHLAHPDSWTILREGLPND